MQFHVFYSDIFGGTNFIQIDVQFRLGSVRKIISTHSVFGNNWEREWEFRDGNLLRD